MIVRYLLSLFLTVVLYTTASAQPLRLHVVSPNGGEKFQGGSTTTITWTDLYNMQLDSVRLELTTDGGSSWTDIASPVAGGSYTWTVPYLSSAMCRIRATQITGVRHVASHVRTYDSDLLTQIASFTPDGSLLLRIAHGRVDIWRTATGELVRTLLFDDIVWAASFSPDGARVVVAINEPDNPRGEVWDIASNTKLLTLPAPNDPSMPAEAKNEMRAIEYSPDGSRIAMSARFSVSFWDAFTGTLIDSSLEGGSSLFSYSGDGRYLFANGSNLEVRDPSTGTVLKKIKGSFFITDISYDGNFLLGRRSAIGQKDTLVLIDVDKGTVSPIYTWPNHVGRPFGAFHPTLQRILIGREFDTVIIVRHFPNGWHAPNFRDIAFLNEFSGTLRDAIFHPDGLHIAAQSGAERRLELWAIDPTDISDSNFAIESSRQVLPTVTLAGVKVGTSADTTLVAHIRNTGASPLIVQEVALGAGDREDFSVLDPGGFTLAPGDRRDLRIRFQPTTRGERSIWLEVRTVNDTIVGEIRGVGLKGVLTAVKTVIYFGEVVVNQPRELWVHTYKNTGTAPLRIDSLFTGGTHAGLYTITDAWPPAPFVLQPGDTHAITIRCTPASPDFFYSNYVVYRDEYGERYELLLQSRGVWQAGVDEESAIAGGSLLRHIAPNPASTDLRIGCMGRAGEEIVVDIVDVMGRIVRTERQRCVETGLQEMVIDVRMMPSGTYVARVTSDGKYDARLVVVQR